MKPAPGRGGCSALGGGEETEAPAARLGEGK